MPGIDLTTLSGPDLKRLLKIAHSRNDGPLADKLEWEIASRGAGVGRPAGPFASPPDDDPDEPDFRMTVPDDDPGEPDFRMTMPDDDPGEPDLRMTMPDAEPFTPEPLMADPLMPEFRAREPASGGSGVMLLSLGVLAGALISGGLFWGLQRMDTSPAPEKPAAPRAMAALPAAPAKPAPAPAPVRHGADQVAAALAPGPFPPRPQPVAPRPEPIAPVAQPPAPVEAAVPPPATAPVEVAKEEPQRTKQEATRAERAERTPAVRLAKAEPAPRNSASRDACERSTPADRLVCGDLGLRLADFEMRDAYARALNARADPAVVGAGQTAWRLARDQVSDPDRLARLYALRIRELDAATAAARAKRPPG